MRKDIAIFYHQRLPSTLLQGEERTSIVHAGDKPLIENTTSKHTSLNTQLLLTEQSNSVFTRLGPVHRTSSFTPYGYTCSFESAAQLYFTGQLLQPVTGHYLLGSRRGFNPVTMRFNSYDDLSPFREGGINGYAYCSDDPVNRKDPSGRIFEFLRRNRSARTTRASQYQPNVQPTNNSANLAHAPARRVSQYQPNVQPTNNSANRAHAPANWASVPATLENYNSLMEMLGHITYEGVDNITLKAYIPPRELAKAITQRPYYPHYNTKHEFYTSIDTFHLTKLQILMKEEYGLLEDFETRKMHGLDNAWTVIGYASHIAYSLRKY